VANFLRLRQLPDQIKDSIIEGHLSMGHARALLGVEQPARQMEIWRRIVSKGLSVRETEELIKREKAAAKKVAAKPNPTSEQIYLADLADNLSRTFGTKVKINRRGRKGKVEIEFYSDEDLNRLIEMLRQT
jgi:ParB family chromosome partitioning protein